MVTEDYVSFETAKLLKEKGFNEECLMWYYGKDIINFDGNPLKADTLLKARTNSGTIKNEHTVYACTAPALQMAMKWLEVEHGIFITVMRGIGGNGFVYTPYIFDKDSNQHNQHSGYDSRAEAEEAAIKYCLENLV